MNRARTVEDELFYLPYLWSGKLSLPFLFPTLFHLLSVTPTLPPYTTDHNIFFRWQNASSAFAYLNLLCFIIPATSSLAAEQKLYLTADIGEVDFLQAAVQDTTTRSQLRDGEEMLRHWREARAAFEAKTMDVQRNQEKVDAWSRVEELLVEMAGLLGKAVVVEAESNEEQMMKMNLRPDFGQARERLEALRTEIVEVAERVEVICGKMPEPSDAGAASSRRTMEQISREREKETQRMIDEVIRRCKEDEELGVGPLQRSIKEEDEQDVVMPSVESLSTSFGPGSPPRSPPPFPPRLSKAWDDEVGVVSSQHESQDEMPTPRIREEEDLEIDDGREPEGVFRMSL